MQRRPLRRAQNTIAVLFLVFFANAALAVAKKPPVPAGTDAGGVRIAIIGEGVDYTQPGIAARLARDGEGEIIGWDFAGDDRRPFAASDVAKAQAETTRIILSEGQSATLVVIRTNSADPVSLAKALRYAAQGPARIIAMQWPWTNPGVARVLPEAARHYPDRLFIAVAGNDSRDLDAGDRGDAGRPSGAEVAGNIIIATAADANGDLTQGANWGAQTVDLAIDVQSRGPREGSSGDAAAPSRTGVAQARLAALAVRLVAVAPDLDGNGLKRRICALARRASGAKPSTRTGFIADPWKPFWLE